MSERIRSRRPDPPRPEYPEIGLKPRRGKTPPDPSTIKSIRDTPAQQQSGFQATPVLRRQFGSTSNRDWYHFAIELRTLLIAGMPLVEALNFLSKHGERESLRRTAYNVADAVTRGMNLESAMQGERKRVPELLRTLLIIGNNVGRLPYMLDVIASHFSWLMEMRRSIIKVLWYPYFLVIAGSCIMAMRDTIMMALTSSSVMSAVATSVQRYVIPVIFSSLAGYALTRLFRFPLLRKHVDHMALVIPVIGDVVHKYAVAVFLDVFATLLEAGVPMISAYEIAAGSCPNRIIRAKLDKWTFFLRDGESLLTTLTQTRVFKQEVLAMVAAGEATASAPPLMRKVSEYYNRDVRVTIVMLHKILSPGAVLAVAFGFFADPTLLSWLAFIIIFLIFLV